jgi:DNA-directed RNA polymerase specialized sigma24 family protein
MRTMKIRPGREPTSARTWGPNRIPAARDGQETSSEHGIESEHETPAERDASAEEDIVQDAFAAGHGRWHVQPDPDAALAYLRWSVVHRSRSVPPLGDPDAGEPGSAVVSALRALSPRQREVVVLQYFADLSEAEIAAATGMSMAAVRDHAVQAMSSLQAELE